MKGDGLSSSEKLFYKELEVEIEKMTYWKKFDTTRFYIYKNGESIGVLFFEGDLDSMPLSQILERPEFKKRVEEEIASYNWRSIH